MKTQKKISTIQEDIEQFAPTLATLKKTNPFKVPNNYFEELPTIVQKRCVELDNKHKTSVLHQLISVLNHQLSIPIAMLFILFYFGIKNIKIDKQNHLLSSNDISEYFDKEMINSIDENVLVEVIIESYQKTNSNKENINEDEIDFLIDNNIDINAIVNEF